MGQFEILGVLNKKRGKWLCKRDFIEDLNVSDASVIKSMRRIKKRNLMFNIKVRIEKKTKRTYFKII